METRNRVSTGPVTDRVARNIRALRDVRRLTLEDLAQRLRELGRPIIKSGLSKIESGGRRVDVDDLLALAVALEVNPNRLLLGPEAAEDDEMAITPDFAVPSQTAWDWANGEVAADAPWPWAKFSGPNPSAARFMRETRPHEPQLSLTPQEYERLRPWVSKVSRILADMHAAGVRPEHRTYVLDLNAGDGRLKVSNAVIELNRDPDGIDS